MVAVVTDYGAGWLADAIRNDVNLSTLYVHCGTGTNNLAKSRTTLVTPVSPETRVAATVSEPSGLPKYIRVYGEITFQGTKTIKEVGVFTSSTGSNLIAQDTLNQDVVATDKIQFTIDIAISN